MSQLYHRHGSGGWRAAKTCRRLLFVMPWMVASAAIAQQAPTARVDVAPWRPSQPSPPVVRVSQTGDRAIAHPVEATPAADADSVLDNLLGGDSKADDLDQLLDMADQDVGQLSQVNVSSATMAPALNTEVSTVSRQKSTVGRSPAAVFVITNEMIRRSGARSLPEVLRMAPGVQVARIDSNKWAISIRGFNGRVANKLLVQIDGRTVYTPLFGGVFWDVQDVLLEDVERIEVIRGPGASVWGANAVNGIINVITKSAHETQGALVQGGAGTFQRGFANARYGGALAPNASYRVYGKWFERDGGSLPAAAEADDWRMARGGFRMDWQASSSDHLTLQGDYYDGSVGQLSQFADPNPPFFRIVGEDTTLSGGNAIFRWTHEVNEQEDWILQLYYDRTERQYENNRFREDLDTFDLDFQYRLPFGDFHNVVVGAGYRNLSDRINNAPLVFEFFPPARSVDLFSYFVQDEMTLIQDELYFTLGSKFIHSDYSPFEFQPTARLLWTPTDRHSLWGSVSRGVRLPTRAGQNVRVTLPPNPALPGVFPQVLGNPNFQSEDVLAWEAGMRAQPMEDFSWDFAMFYNRYSDLQNTQTGFPFFDPAQGVVVLPMTIVNNGRGETYGAELAANAQLAENWRIYGAYTYLQLFVNGGGGAPGDSARNQAYLQSSWDLWSNWELDVIWRYVDSIPFENVPSYNVMDVRLGCQLTRDMELAIVGRNLLDRRHPEFGNDEFTGAFRTEVDRSVYAMLTWRR